MYRIEAWVLISRIGLGLEFWLGVQALVGVLVCG